MSAEPLKASPTTIKILRTVVGFLFAAAACSANEPPTKLNAAGLEQAAAGTSVKLAHITAFEPSAPPTSQQNRLVVVAGLGQSTPSPNSDASIAAARTFLAWWSTPEAEKARATWQICVVPNALPDGPKESPLTFPPVKGFFNDPVAPESRALWRWSAMSCPDLVVDLRDAPAASSFANSHAAPLFPNAKPAADQELVTALGSDSPSGIAAVPAVRIEGTADQLVTALRDLVGRKLPHSKLRDALEQRANRDPLEVARILAAKYPQSPGMSYIPALAWSGAIQLSQLTGDPAFRQKALSQMTPFLDGSKPALSEKANLPSIAGHLAFSDLARMESSQNAAALARTAAEHLLRTAPPTELVPSATKWTDDMFMATSVLARVAGQTNDAACVERTQRLLETYAVRLQREDGIFIHVESSPFAWGRGNGFAAFGLMDALTHLPKEADRRDALLERFRKQMLGLIKHQSPDGSWRQVVDEPGAYRELTVTAMVTTAMARGIRLGWLDQATFLPVVERGWRAVSVRVAPDASLIDVCTGTGAKKDCDKSHYLHRDAIFGPDDRGGAMALTAALEIHALRSSASR
jgi:unsaturated rhamnogalacturonyl hydrolase